LALDRAELEESLPVAWPIHCLFGFDKRGEAEDAAERDPPRLFVCFVATTGGTTAGMPLRQESVTIRVNLWL